MSPRFEPKIDILPPAQHRIWPQLAPAARLSFVLYGGTAIALHLGHRQSLDFDFFSAGPLAKHVIDTSFDFMREAGIAREEPETLVVAARTAGEPVKIPSSATSALATSTSLCGRRTACSALLPSKTCWQRS